MSGWVNVPLCAPNDRTVNTPGTMVPRNFTQVRSVSQMLGRGGTAKGERETPQCVSPCHNIGSPLLAPSFTPSVSKPSLPATSLALKVEPSPSGSLRPSCGLNSQSCGSYSVDTLEKGT